MSRRETAGALLIIGATQFALAANICEAMQEDFSVQDSLLSDLGVWGEPSALLFNASLIAFGFIGLGIGYLLRGDDRLTFMPLLFALSGIGMLIMGLFPISVEWAHDAGAFLAFVLIALVALSSFWTFRGLFRYLSLGLASAALLTMVLYKAEVYLGLGAGGMERMIVYPLFLWMAAFGGVLMLSDGNIRGDSVLHRFFNFLVNRSWTR